MEMSTNRGETRSVLIALSKAGRFSIFLFIVAVAVIINITPVFLRHPEGLYRTLTVRDNNGLRGPIININISSRNGESLGDN